MVSKKCRIVKAKGLRTDDFSIAKHEIMMKKFFLFYIFLGLSLTMQAQRPNYSKMSSMLRQVVHEHDVECRNHEARSNPGYSILGQSSAPSLHHSPINRHPSQEVCSFIRISQDGDQVLANNQCRKLAQFGDIYIASIPIDRMGILSLDPRVLRIEANRSHNVHTDIAARYVNALPAYEGKDLPQAFTGKDVVMGVMDIGFDLTHPNFYDATASHYRIKRMWDHITPDTLDSKFYVGRDYVGTEELLSVAHSYDGLDQTHGTHTLGIAAGSGYGSPYRGIAYESDICLVSNACGEDLPLIDSANVYKYTYATDALGFKYIFDYADSVGKPCVISFSEGSPQDFYGYDLLYYAILDSIMGPGHILVASAGNDADYASYFHKEPGRELAGNFLYSLNDHCSGTIKTDHDIDIRTVVYHNGNNDTILVNTSQILQLPDSEFVDTFYVADIRYIIDVYAYPSCYEEKEMCYDYSIFAMGRLGGPDRVSLELIGREADVHYYKTSGYLIPQPDFNPMLNDGENICNIHSPASAPNVICVGATGYRTGITNYLGVYKANDRGTDGIRSGYSSVGPTYDGRIKPDVVAPGTNVISSYSSYYLENHPTANDISWDVEHFDFKGRTYAWNSNTGTSMSTPVVAGAIALWLQANPRLTPEDIKGILSRTCLRVDESLTYPNIYYGYGQVDVYKGLLDVLGTVGIENISGHQPQGVSIRPTPEGIVTLSFVQAPDVPYTVQVYQVSGSLLRSFTMPANETTASIDLRSLSKGVYIVQVNGPTAVTKGSTLIRR